MCMMGQEMSDGAEDIRSTPRINQFDKQPVQYRLKQPTRASTRQRTTAATMLFSTYLSLALASFALAAPQDAQRCPNTITKTSTVPTTVTKCTAKVSTITKPGKPSTVTKPTTVTLDPVTVTPSCPSPTSPATRLIEVIGFAYNRCYNPPVASSGDIPSVQLVSLSPPATPTGGRGNCVSFDNGRISSLLFESIPDNLLLANSCRLFAFRKVACDESSGSVAIDISAAQRGLCQDPTAFNDIYSVQVRC